MFTGWAVRSGLFNRLAPRKKQEKESSTDDTDGEKTAEKTEEEEMLRLEREHTKRVLEGQRKREMKASAEGRFTKNQRVRYFKKSNSPEHPDTYKDAHIVDVHYDDGIENPYYTIQYEREDGDRVEKQTTGDRLKSVDFEEEQAWAILSEKK